MSVRGYVDYKPQEEARYWITCAKRILNEYRQYWPLTVRQVFYRMVAEYQYDKTEAAYGKLANMIARARRAYPVNRSIGIPFGAIRDDRMRYDAPFFYEDEAAFIQSLKESATAFTLDRQRGQDQVIELWCEAAGMLPILSEIGEEYGLRTSSGGGYDSVTSKHKLSQRAIERAKNGTRTVVLHVGDFDGSGEDMAEVMREDVATMTAQMLYSADWAPHFDDKNDKIDWATGFFSLDRVALTAEQVIEYSVETAPPKPSDSRTNAFIERNWELVDQLGSEDISAQLEALTPPDLQRLLRTAIEERIDMDTYQEVLREEEETQESLAERLENL